MEAAFPGRFDYNATRKFDFIDKFTGEIIELTTTKQAGNHAARLGGWESIVTYTPFP
ncbi:hypothetical protein [Cellvibrio sp.]|uniref:hypothetical protein n=1 Tax=Cellvibrio sp. TaxID=1965322 RepID=UPI00396478A0